MLLDPDPHFQKRIRNPLANFLNLITENLNDFTLQVFSKGIFFKKADFLELTNKLRR
jgi:hypothetical protein